MSIIFAETPLNLHPKSSTNFRCMLMWENFAIIPPNQLSSPPILHSCFPKHKCSSALHSCSTDPIEMRRSTNICSQLCTTDPTESRLQKYVLPILQNDVHLRLLQNPALSMAISITNQLENLSWMTQPQKLQFRLERAGAMGERAYSHARTDGKVGQ